MTRRFAYCAANSCVAPVFVVVAGDTESARNTPRLAARVSAFFSSSNPRKYYSSGGRGFVCIHPCIWTRTARRMSFSREDDRCSSASRGTPRCRRCGYTPRWITTPWRCTRHEWEATSTDHYCSEAPHRDPTLACTFFIEHRPATFFFMCLPTVGDLSGLSGSLMSRLILMPSSP